MILAEELEQVLKAEENVIANVNTAIAREVVANLGFLMKENVRLQAQVHKLQNEVLEWKTRAAKAENKCES